MPQPDRPTKLIIRPDVLTGLRELYGTNQAVAEQLQMSPRTLRRIAAGGQCSTRFIVSVMKVTGRRTDDILLIEA